jgi:3'-phosphoadenosine 5'-phosphosulfate sulfotransferase (PAPS reductase)/FAD synthetase
MGRKIKAVEPSLFSDGRNPQGFVAEACAILERAIATYEPRAIYALFSGGHDSLCSTAVAMMFPACRGVVHIDTQTGIPETLAFVRTTCAAQSWPLVELRPPPFFPAAAKRKPEIDYGRLSAYEALVLHYGFPGPGGHQVPYNCLKERCLRQLRRATFGLRRRKGDVMLLVGGARLHESARRMGNAEEMHLEASEGRAWCSPLLWWDNDDKAAFLEMLKLPRNPVVERLCMSGECLCGAFARPHELVEIEAAYPDVAVRLRALEVRAKALGVPCRWGERPAPLRVARADQPELFSLCWSCGNKWEDSP